MPLEPMIEATRELTEQVLEAVEVVEGTRLPEGSFSNVVLCGMGGSSIGGALARAHLDDRIEVPLHVLRDHEPPTFVSEDTLAVATSYSGNTTETVDATQACLDAGAALVAVTTGGRLGALAEDAGASTVEVPEGYEPRAAVGWLWAANQGLLTRAFDLGGLDRLRSAATRLRDRVDDLALEGGPADRIAGELGEGPVGVVGHDAFGVIARRWAGELSENGKRLAFHACLPEAVHNQIVGWAGEPGDATLLLVRREDEAPLEEVRFQVLAERAEKAGARVVEAEIPGAGLEASLEAVLLGDLVSLHLARREGTDPEPVRVIDDLKDRLAEVLGR